jgi:myo-inositol-1(or 4)-monophosphatase
MPAHDIPRFLGFADALADVARAEVLPFFRANHKVTDKGGARFDPVTDADQAAERAMRKLIEREFPDHGVHGEEFEKKLSDSPYQWVLDPIDGTRAFISGLPLWGVLIALYYEGRPIVGVMDQPYLDERYRGWTEAADAVVRGQARPLRTRPCASLGDAILSTTDPYLFEGDEAQAFARVRRAAKLTRFGYDCYAYAMIAAGHIDCVIESGLKAFDIGALIPIITGAGGGVCAWDGGDASAGGRVLAYGDPRRRNEFVELLEG